MLIMSRADVEILIIEKADLLYEGLAVLIRRNFPNIICRRIADLSEAGRALAQWDIHLVLTNSYQLANRMHELKNLKAAASEIAWAAYNTGTPITNQVIQDIFLYSDSEASIVSAIEKEINKSNEENNPGEDLSEREIEVLIALVHGLANKEIADKLHISIHTVLSHRKNISRKTGIRSQSGLTIYALSEKIIRLEDLAVRKNQQ